MLSEGYATAASIHEATHRPVVCVFDAGNLLPVAKAFKGMYPDKIPWLMGDDDYLLPLRDPPLPNTGRVKATKAAQLLSGYAVFPDFTEREREQGLTDFNDLMVSRGKEAFRCELKRLICGAISK
jgi:phage/plasmid primase-like uncharacterized protein